VDPADPGPHRPQPGVTVVELLWQVGGLDAAQAAEAARRRERYIDAATVAGDRAAAPFVAWMDGLASYVEDLAERTRAVLKETAAARQQL